MVLHFKGGYNHDNERLPHEEIKRHPEAVKFKEFSNAPLFLLVVNLLSVFILVITATIFHFLSGIRNISVCGVLLVIVSLIPHEIIHAMFFRGDVYLYIHNLALIITGTEPMSKKRYIAMCLTPTIIFGFIPFILFLINPQLTILGTLGGISIPLGLGDFYNVYNCIKQVPNDGICFMNKQNTYWYVPQKRSSLPDWGWSKQTIGSDIHIILAVIIGVFTICFGLYNREDVVLMVLFLMAEMSLYCLFGYYQIKYRN